MTATRIVGLLPPTDVDGPRVRLGLAWGALTLLAALLGPVAIAVVFAPVALGAAGQTARTWRRDERRPHRPVAVGGATVCALAGAVGPLAVAGVVAAIVAAAAATQVLRPGGRAWDARTTVAVGVAIGVGAAAPALVHRQLGLLPALVLLLSVHAVEAGTFIVGAGARARWEGPLAGAASVAALSLAVAAVLVPPFRGASPWVLGTIVALAVPAGTIAASTLLGRAGTPVPALRRLDGYVVTGPLWLLAGRLLLDLG